ncbi:MAG: hypothetical protein RIR26_2526, partial [Pseudomonadota bacterium]
MAGIEPRPTKEEEAAAGTGNGASHPVMAEQRQSMPSAP